MVFDPPNIVVIGSFLIKFEIGETMSAFAGGLLECLVHAKKF